MGGKGADQVGDGSGVSAASFSIQSHCRGGGLAGGCPGPKGGGGVLRSKPRVIWKVVAVIINRCFNAAITYQNLQVTVWGPPPSRSS